MQIAPLSHCDRGNLAQGVEINAQLKTVVFLGHLYKRSNNHAAFTDVDNDNPMTFKAADTLAGYPDSSDGKFCLCCGGSTASTAH